MKRSISELRGVRILIEQPLSSLLWLHARLAKLLRDGLRELREARFPMGAFQGGRKKNRTNIIVNVTCLFWCVCFHPSEPHDDLKRAPTQLQEGPKRVHNSQRGRQENPKSKTMFVLFLFWYFWAALGALLAPSWDILGPPGASWGPLAAVLGP